MRRKRRRRPPIGWRNSVQILCLQEEEDEEEEEEVAPVPLILTPQHKGAIRTIREIHHAIHNPIQLRRICFIIIFKKICFHKSCFVKERNII